MLRRNYISTCILIMTCYLLPLIAQDPAIIITYGDSAYNNFENKMALNYYSQVLEMDSVNYEAAWKLARAYVDVGETFSDKNKRKQFYSKAADLARRAVEIDSMGANGHLYLSISLGRVALDAGAKERIRLSKEIKAEVDRALELDSDNDIAWHVLGRWHRKLATLSWIEKKFAGLFLGGVPKEASVEKSAECFQKAIVINPDHINHHLELAMTYEKLKRDNDAITEYRKVLDLPKKDSDDENHKKHARERLSKLD